MYPKLIVISGSHLNSLFNRSKLKYLKIQSINWLLKTNWMFNFQVWTELCIELWTRFLKCLSVTEFSILGFVKRQNFAPYYGNCKKFYKYLTLKFLDAKYRHFHIGAVFTPDLPNELSYVRKQSDQSHNFWRLLKKNYIRFNCEWIFWGYSSEQNKFLPKFQRIFHFSIAKPNL